MIEHICLCRLRPEASDAGTLEWMMRETRSRLLKIPAVLAVRCGRNIETSGEWAFFYSVVLDSESRIAAFHAHAVHKKFQREVLERCVRSQTVMDFETVPGDDPLFL